ncbi:hypothetical protein M407DRAFT_28336 [Tulasnella calospora MUT 4182]|uniref:Protein kinase domain-containing protein n=1 Tax=Tulasnella calospora MUT 4182 TaxID=1051891 RepID=A0A0C3QAW7_9AGAM|nr:hypothetical protein M407DRAFT_28336 [Tulasnella calospora MUT 4182]
MSAADDPDELKRAFTKELLVWSGLEAHPRVARFMGFYADFERSEAWLLSPWEPHGNIADFISRRRLEVPEKLSLVYDTIDALTFLHQLEPPVCHGDIKSANVLVNCDCRAVLCDFGLARLHEDSGFRRLETSTGFKGSIRWCSPELLDGGPRTSSSDIYAWAWLVWEIMTGELPYQDAMADYAIIRRIFESSRPQVDGESRLSDCLQLWELMTRCWVVEPEQRPTGSMCRTAVVLLPRCTPHSGKVDPLSPSPELLENLGTLESWKGNSEESIAHLEMALRLYQDRDDSNGVARVHSKQADVFYRHSRWVPSIDHATAALTKFRSLDDDLGAADALFTLGCAIYMHSTAEEATPPLQEALEIFRIHSHDVGTANCLERLGEICRWNLRLTEATTYLEDAIAITSESGNKVGETGAAKCLAYVFWQSGDNARAVATFTVTAEAGRRLGLGSVLCDSLYCLATINYEEGNYEDSRRVYQESISAARSIDDGFTLSKSLEGLAKVHRVQGDFAQAATSLEELWTCYQTCHIGILTAFGPRPSSRKSKNHKEM